MRAGVVRVGSIALLSAVLFGSSSHAAEGYWSGAGWYSFITTVDNIHSPHGGPFETEDACVSDYNAHPSSLSDVTWACHYEANEDDYYDDVIAD